MKKTIMALSASVAMLTAAQADACHSWGNKFHIGFQGGMLNFNSKATFKGNKNTAASQTTDIGKNGYTGAIAFGYTMQFNANFAAFVEAYIGKDHAEGKDQNKNNNGNTEDTTKASKKKVYYGISVNPSLVINQNTLVFVKMGYEFGKHELSLAVQNQDIEKGSKKSNFVLGLGIKTMVTNNIVVGFAAEHLFLRNAKVNFKNSGDLRELKSKNSANRFLVSVAYKF